VLYRLTKYLVRLGLLIFFRKIVFENKFSLTQEGPLLLACNHPNSFLDALILGSYFKHPVHFLARGDAFKNPLAKKILTALKVIPIYRLSEGKEYFALNDTTFERCTDILKEGGIVLIFSEGLCLNQWKLRDLKKGSARIALNAWKQQEIENSFRILPVSLNYSSFTRFRKNVFIHFEKTIQHADLPIEKPEGEQIIELNKLIYSRLGKGLLLEENDRSVIIFLLSNLLLLTGGKKLSISGLKEKQIFLRNRSKLTLDKLRGTNKVAGSTAGFMISFSIAVLLFVPAVIGMLVNLPLYIPMQKFIRKKTLGTVFYHSAMFGASIIIYPVYAAIIAAVFAIVFGGFTFIAAFFLLPFLALIALEWLDCLERTVNYFKLSKSERKRLQSLGL
jgi:1-acyl-sn-glycerol-3-phosphate acyltransferase